jgi:hypothetical protein
VLSALGSCEKPLEGAILCKRVIQAVSNGEGDAGDGVGNDIGKELPLPR